MFTTNIFSNKFEVIFASSIVPEDIISPRPVPCSIAINAPVFVSAKLETAFTISLTYIFLCSLSSKPCLSSKALLPKCSKALLISG